MMMPIPSRFTLFPYTTLFRSIELFDLGSFIDDLTERYSHGMRQRAVFAAALLHEPQVLIVDRKSTRLNSSHVAISYAVFCLKKKKSIIILASSYLDLSVDPDG